MAEKIEIGKMYKSRFCGDFKVLKEDGYRGSTKCYIVEFLLTKYKTSARADHIRKGDVGDPYYPKIYGVGYLGAKYGTKIDSSMRGRWERMISRCYNLNDVHYYAYGGAGVTVCERWHCYVNFVEDCKQLPGYNNMIDNPHIKYHLDKDILQQGVPTNQKVYSPTTCMFVPARENISQLSIDYKNEYQNSYHNVYKNEHDKYLVNIKVNNIVHRLGRYENEIVAANHSNHARCIYGLPILNTDVPYIPPEIVNSQNLKKLPDMVTIIKKEMVKIIK